VITGWVEGLLLLGKGGKAEFVMPSELAFGDQGSDSSIPGGATLVFKTKLFRVLAEFQVRHYLDHSARPLSRN
jgi:FKBP-type peptidyl-prolyl cis-trans isomerase